MSAINYSKWDHIEVSDDEDDVHPNIDTPSLFRWRHDARVQRMDEAKQEKDQFEKQYQDNQQKLQKMKQTLKEKENEKQSGLESLDKIKAELTELEKQEQEFKKKEEELKKKDRMTPWNIDTLCKDGKSKTIINKDTKKDTKELTEDERAEKQVQFAKKYKSEIKKFGMTRKYEASQEYLAEHPYLVCEETANFLVLWCIDLEIEEKHDLMEHVSHQTIVMQFILELSKQMDVDPRQCAGPFFSRIKMAQKEYLEAFNDELNGFKGRIKARAKQKIEDAIKEHEEEEKQKRLGPGGIDPVEVFESLPQTLKDCFEAKDIPMLQKAILDLPKEEAEYHMKRCVESGLWVPNAGDLEEQEQATGVQESGESNIDPGDDDVYEKIH